MRKLFLLLPVLAISAPAFAQAPEDEARICAVIAEWYKRIAQPEAKAPWALMARKGIEARARLFRDSRHHVRGAKRRLFGPAHQQRAGGIGVAVHV